ncbi:Cro/CI family transcriptional regulator [Aeromonas caviae]|uniref:Cro/CI family transcriptional regulator n=1 Tax=Aeromonas caviae TaxID=648 RepID=UPI002B481D77|nr:Cro/CI family transcriptional regulator [Aeromonas caviae]
MNKSDVLSYFGGVAATAKALGISHVAVSKWGDTIPQGRAYQIEVLTGGALKADPAAPSGQQRQYQRVAPGTSLDEIPCVKRATADAKADPTNAQPGKA